MVHAIYTTFYIFFILLQIILLMHMLSSWFSGGARFKSLLSLLIEPVLAPVRYLLKYSIFNNPAADLSPLIGFVIILFLQDFFGMLL